MLELDLESRSEALRAARAGTASRYFITGELNTPVADVALKLQELEERFGPEGTVSHLDGVSVGRRRLAFQRAAVEHGAAAAPEPRGALAGADGAEARRGARVIRDERGECLTAAAAFKFSARTRVGFSDTDAQGVVYYGRYMPYFDLARVEYHRHLDMLRTDPATGSS